MCVCFCVCAPAENTINTLQNTAGGRVEASRVRSEGTANRSHTGHHLRVVGCMLLENHVRGLFGNHDDGGARVARRQLGHDGSVDDTELAGAVRLETRVHHVGTVVSAHPARRDRVEDGGGNAAHLRQNFVVLLVLRTRPLLHRRELLERRRRHQVAGPLDAAHSLVAVVLRRQVVGVDCGRCVDRRRRQVRRPTGARTQVAHRHRHAWVGVEVSELQSLAAQGLQVKLEVRSRNGVRRVGDCAERARRHGQRSRALQGVLQSHLQHGGVALCHRVHRHGAVLQTPHGPDLQMVRQVLAHPRRAVQHRHTILLKDARVPDTAHLEKVWAAHGACSQHNLALRPHKAAQAVLPVLDSLRFQRLCPCRLLRVAEPDAVGPCVRFDQKVAAGPHRVQEGCGGRHTKPVVLVDLEVAAPRLVAVVEAPPQRQPLLLGCPLERVQDVPRRPRLCHLPLAADPVRVVRPQKVVHPTLEVRQHLVPRPAFVLGAPRVVVCLLPPHVDLPVDAAAAAQHLPTRHGNLPPVQCLLRRGLEAPVAALVHHREQVPDGNLVPDPIRFAAGLQKDHAGVGILAEAVCEHTAGGSSAYNHVVRLRHLVDAGMRAPSLRACAGVLRPQRERRSGSESRRRPHRVWCTTRETQ
eukprot:Rhum_TRINITY_DN11896_c0_g2::Rhum_TRINITY_DN11896_c0_g2_i1::g.47361::m.47361